jgi:hypothetical protein
MLFLCNEKIQQSQRFLTFFAAVGIKVHRISIYVCIVLFLSLGQKGLAGTWLPPSNTELYHV